MRATLTALANDMLPRWLEQLGANGPHITRHEALRFLLRDHHFPRGLVARTASAVSAEAATWMVEKAHSERRERRFSPLLFGRSEGLETIALGLGSGRKNPYYAGGGKVPCSFDAGRNAQFAVAWSANNAEGVAQLLGTTVDALPPLLRGWSGADDYRGNSILDRIDPADWVIEHPLDGKKIQFSVAMSKQAFLRMTGLKELPAFAKHEHADKRIKVIGQLPSYLRKATKEAGFEIVDSLERRGD